MDNSEVQNLKQANAIVRTWVRRHNEAAILMAIPLVVGVAMMNFFPSALSDIVLAAAPATAMTIGVAVIPEDFHSRRGSMSSAIFLVMALWAAALVAWLIRLHG